MDRFTWPTAGPVSPTRQPIVSSTALSRPVPTQSMTLPIPTVTRPVVSTASPVVTKILTSTAAIMPSATPTPKEPPEQPVANDFLSKNKGAVIAIVVVGIVLLFMLITLIIMHCEKRNKARAPPVDQENSHHIEMVDLESGDSSKDDAKTQSTDGSTNLPGDSNKPLPKLPPGAHLKRAWKKVRWTMGAGQNAAPASEAHAVYGAPQPPAAAPFPMPLTVSLGSLHLMPPEILPLPQSPAVTEFPASSVYSSNSGRP